MLHPPRKQSSNAQQCCPPAVPVLVVSVLCWSISAKPTAVWPFHQVQTLAPHHCIPPRVLGAGYTQDRDRGLETSQTSQRAAPLPRALACDMSHANDPFNLEPPMSTIHHGIAPLPTPQRKSAGTFAPPFFFYVCVCCSLVLGSLLAGWRPRSPRKGLSRRSDERHMWSEAGPSRPCSRFMDGGRAVSLLVPAGLL